MAYISHWTIRQPT